ncbi:MAG: hypothetical protein CYG59_05115 [Chloroflexi bacterium]|nr:MAG: hypothetical protein CYG59_05115 [Chloroflexota bacterium]
MVSIRSTEDDVLSVSDLDLLASYAASRYRLSSVQVHRVVEQSVPQYAVVAHDEAEIAITIDLVTARQWIARQAWTDRMAL